MTINSDKALTTGAIVDISRKRIAIYGSKEKLLPKYLFHLCEKILWVDNNFEDWREWTILIIDTDTFVVGELSKMDSWEK